MLIKQIISNLYQGEKLEHAGRTPVLFVVTTFFFPLLLSICLQLSDIRLADNVKSSVLQIVSILTGILVASLIPVFQLCSDYSISKDKFKKELDEVTRDKEKFKLDFESRINVLTFMYNSILYSLMLCLGLIIFNFLTINFTLMIYGVELSDYIEKTFEVVYVFLAFSLFFNFLNMIKYLTVFVGPLLKEISNILK